MEIESGFAVLRQPYLIVSFIPCYRDANGDLWLEQAWHKDVVQHLRYIKDLLLCAPVLQNFDGRADLCRIETPDDAKLRLIPLPPQVSATGALRALPRTVLALWRAVGSAAIVHSSVVGWPYPLGWIANPLSVLRGKGLVIVVESSWRRGDAEPKRWRVKLRETLSESIARWSCRHARVSFFTQPEYRAALHPGGSASAYITPAVWIEDGDILTDAAAETIWNLKLKEPVRLLFAGRLLADKGVDVMLTAMRLLDERGVRAQVDIIGAGERRDRCVRVASTTANVRVSVLDPVAYGKPFFELVQRYHALLVPSLTDEQPRVVFDANAQAVPIIASDTAGLRPHIEQGQTGWLMPVGDPVEVANMIERATSSGTTLHVMGMAALRKTRGHTHTGMHEGRSQILKHYFR